MPPLWRKAAKFCARHWPATALILFLTGVIMTPHSLERFFVYYPVREISQNPSNAGLRFEDLYLTTADGVVIHGWNVPREGARATLLVFHGNAGNIGHRVPWIEMLHKLGTHVLIIDYRGYGRSEGRPFEKGLYLDADAAHAWWRGRAGSREKLFLLGESLGGAVAVDLASRTKVDGLILQSTFSSARDMARTIMPLGLLRSLAGIHFDSEAKIGRVQCPKLFIHGEQDEIVPFRLGRKLFETSPEPRRFVTIPHAGHNDLIWAAGSDYLRVLEEFLGEAGA